MIKPEARAKSAAARAQQLLEGTRRTTRPGSESTVLNVGDLVRVDLGPRGSWQKWHRRKGVVASINEEIFPYNRGTHVEIGVHFGPVKPDHLIQAEAHAWFRDDELIMLKPAVRAVPERQSDEPAPEGQSAA